MCQSGITPIVYSAVIEYASFGAMNADVGTEALGRMTVSAPRPRVASSTAARSLTVRMLRELVCLRPVRWAVPAGVSGGDEGKNRA